MVPDARSSFPANNRQFDFNSQAGVLLVLAAIRKSDCTTAVRNELRDLVFLYSNGGGDPAVRNVLEERLKTYNVTLSEVAVQAVVPPPILSGQQSGFSSGRPLPVFVPGVVIKNTSTVHIPVAPQKNEQLLPKDIQDLHRPATQLVDEAPTVTVAPIVRPSVLYQSVKVSAPRPVPVPERVVEVRPPAPQITPILPAATPIVAPAAASVVVPESTSAPTPVAGSVLSPGTEARLERIREIKALVNGRVGNPVNLVDINNEIGREYMSALLEAMKLLSSASEIDSARAMTRLEAVFVQVTTLLNPTPVSTIIEVSAPLVIAPAPVLAAAVSPAFTEPQPSPTIFPTFPNQTVPIKLPIVPNISDSVNPILPAVPAIPPKVLVFPPTSGAVAIDQNKIQLQTPVAVAEPPLRTITDLPTADQVNKTSAVGDPLFTKEVDNGLNQLLSEWTLFKKSGLFGTGPNGREHPLFIKVASLQIPLLLSGRFEGATQEIKQSVTDYMNGWRYEQGIVYEKGETFEHYLRRVIRHIIDWQNKKRST